MAYLALKRISYLGQFGIFLGFTGVGIVIGLIVSLIPIISKYGTTMVGMGQKELNDLLFKPENADILRLSQFLSTFFIFFIPAVIFAWICHKKPFKHLGFAKKTRLSQVFLVILIMISSLPLVGVLGRLTEMLPFPESTMQMFRDAETQFLQQVEAIGRMNDFKDFLLSLFMLAILPSFFEEVFFRGALQNLLSRWWKLPLLAVIVTSIVFSAIHFSYIGFLSRVVLGFILGWIFHRTGNLWLSIIGHVTNNAFAVTVVYVMKVRNPEMKLTDAGPEFPLWTGAVSLFVVILLLYLFDRVSRFQIDRPGTEVLMQVEDDSNPSWTIS